MSSMSLFKKILIVLSSVPVVALIVRAIRKKKSDNE